MVEKYFIHSFVNVFGVTPTFLLPIFKNQAGELKFQKLENDNIQSFVDAEIKNFSECLTYQNNLGQEDYTIGNPAIYAIDLPDGSFVYGKRENIEDYYYKNIALFQNNPDFCEYMVDFIRDNPTLGSSHSSILSNSADVKKNHINAKNVNKYAYIEEPEETYRTAVYIKRVGLGLRTKGVKVA
jgi:hypothetical protein